MSIAATSAAIVLAATPARAQSAEAESLFNDGDKLMKQGRLDEACDAFEASNRIESRAGTLIRLGECREQNHQLASAWSAYEDALARVKDPRKKKIASDRISALEPRLSHLTVRVPEAARADGLVLLRNGKPLDPGLWNRAVPIDGGDYVIAASAPDRAPWQTTAKVPVAGGDITITVHALEPAAKPAPLAPPPPSRVGAPAEEPPPAPPSAFTPRRKLALAFAGAGVAAAGAGIVLGLSARARQDDAYKLCPDPAAPCASAAQANSLIDAAHTRATAANVSYAVAGAAVLAAGALWLTGAPERRQLAVIPSASGLSIAGSF